MTDHTAISGIWIELDSLTANVELLTRFIDRGCPGTEADCAIIVGPTGIGKSRLLDAVLLHKKRFLPYENEKGTMLPLIRFDAPDSPTAKSIAQLVLQKQGDDAWEKDPRTHQNILMARVFNYLRGQRTEVVVIDEAQGLLAKSGFYAASDFLKRLLNENICPVILSGLEATLGLFANEQFAGRSKLVIELAPYDWFQETHQLEYRQILKGIQNRVPALQSDIRLGSEEIARGLNYVSYGLLRETRQLLEETADVANGAPISLQHLAEAVDHRRHQRRVLGPEKRVNPFRPDQRMPEKWKPAASTKGENEKKKAS